MSDTELELIRRRHRRASTQLGFAVQLGYARLPGRVLRVGEEAHPQILATLASQLGVDSAAFAAYLHGRDTTRREHLLEHSATSASVRFQPGSIESQPAPNAITNSRTAAATASDTGSGVANVQPASPNSATNDRNTGGDRSRPGGWVRS